MSVFMGSVQSKLRLFFYIGKYKKCRKITDLYFDMYHYTPITEKQNGSIF